MPGMDNLSQLVNEESISPGWNRAAWKAWKVSSPSNILIGLFEEYQGDEPVMLGVAWNPATPPHILHGLRHSRFPRVRSAAESRLED